MVRVVFVLCALCWPAAILAQVSSLGSAVHVAVSPYQPKDEYVRPFPTAAEVLKTASSGQDTEAQRPPAAKRSPKAAAPATLPRTRWEHMKGHQDWTRAALAALKSHGKPLVELVPADIATWCAAYPQADAAGRRAFWVGFLSALAKHESTYRPWAVGGGGKWYGLLQILPGTARGYKCYARTGRALKDGGANLSCAIRIMARTVPRDGVIHGYKNRKGRGVTADWGPMHSAAKRRDMAGWLQKQPYCKPIEKTRPLLRPRTGGDH